MDTWRCPCSTMKTVTDTIPSLCEQCEACGSTYSKEPFVEYVRPWPHDFTEILTRHGGQDVRHILCRWCKGGMDERDPRGMLPS